MKTTGIIRRMDDLGRIVIPREVRRTIGAKEGDPFEILVDEENNGLVIMPYQSNAVSKIRAVAESLNGRANPDEYWQIAEELETIAKKLEKLEKK